MFRDASFPDCPILIEAGKIDREETLKQLRNVDQQQIQVYTSFTTLGIDGLKRIVPEEKDSGWLNDETIDFYMWLLSKRDKELAIRSSALIRSYFYTTNFLTNFRVYGYEHVYR